MSMKNTFLDTAEDMDWLFETALKHRTDRAQYESAAIFGNEDCPETIELYRVRTPRVDDNPVTLKYDAQRDSYTMV